MQQQWFIYGCEAWPITEKVTKWVGAWNARRLSLITDREISDEYLVPSFDIVARIRARILTDVTWPGRDIYFGKRKNICREG